MERRKRTLTEDDITAIEEAFAARLTKHHACVVGFSPEVAKALSEFTPEQLGIMRRVMGVMGNAANAIGVTIIVSIAGTVFAMLTKGFWVSLAQGLSKGATK